MSEEERNYMFFKVHDLDGNDKLDGLEIFYSATHHAASEHDHNHEHSESDGSEKVDEANENENNQPSNDSSLDLSADASSLKLLELDENGQIVNKNFNHIIGLYFTPSLLLRLFEKQKLFFFQFSDVLDNFLSLADLNDDGYLNYAEYAAAVKLGNAMTEEQDPELWKKNNRNEKIVRNTISWCDIDKYYFRRKKQFFERLFFYTFRQCFTCIYIFFSSI